jgi:hypothetical protein
MLRSALGANARRPLVILDLGVPRNVEPSARGEPGLRLLDLDDLEPLCPVDRATRVAEAEKLEERAVEEARNIVAWRPCFGWAKRMQRDANWKDNVLFNEYFHGDTALAWARETNGLDGPGCRYALPSPRRLQPPGYILRARDPGSQAERESASARP